MYQRTYQDKVLKQNAPVEKKRRKRFRWKRFLLMVVVILIAVTIVVLVRSPKLQVRNIEVVGTKVADPEEVSLFIRSQIEGSYLYFFPRSSMLLVPTTTLTKRVAARFPRFATVDVRRQGLRDLLVTAVEHEGAYLWCENDESCFFMTKEGVVFSEAPFFSGDAYRRIFMGERKGLPFEPLDEKRLNMIELLIERLPAIGIDPTAFRASSQHQLDVLFSHRGSEATLMIDPENDIEETLEDLATGLTTEPLKSELHNPAKTLQYLDARFANKVVYKFK